MKKKEIKYAVRKAIQKWYGDRGLTNTAASVREDIMKAIDKSYGKRHDIRIKTQ